MKILFIFIDTFFIIFHTMLIIFNCLGWILKTTRKWNLLTLTLTAFSWFFLGIWYGFGYCPSTDWHWQIREILGYPTYSHSYVGFLIKVLTGISLNPLLVDTITLVSFIIALTMSILLNAIDLTRKTAIKKLKDNF